MNRKNSWQNTMRPISRNFMRQQDCVPRQRSHRPSVPSVEDAQEGMDAKATHTEQGEVNDGIKSLKPRCFIFTNHITHPRNTIEGGANKIGWKTRTRSSFRVSYIVYASETMVLDFGLFGQTATLNCISSYLITIKIIVSCYVMPCVIKYHVTILHPLLFSRPQKNLP